MKKLFLLCTLMFLSICWASPHNFLHSVPAKETVQAKEKEPITPDIGKLFVCAREIKCNIVPHIVGKVQTISSTEYLRNFYTYRGRAIKFVYIYENRVFYS